MTTTGSPPAQGVARTVAEGRRLALAVPLACLAVVAGVDVYLRKQPPANVIELGVLDDLAHEATAILVLVAARGIGPLVRRDPAVIAAAVGAFLIDVDHLPQILATDLVTIGGARPYSHSLLTPAALLLAGLAWRSNRRVCIGLAAGVGLHLVRDIATGPGLPLGWPLTGDMVLFPYEAYAAVIAGAAALATARWRGWLPGRRGTDTQSDWSDRR